MTHSNFATEFEKLPGQLAVFPLQGSALLPFTRLDLNIFEPRYLNMTLDALGNGRLIGMIQPLTDENKETVGDKAALHDIGCAGRVVSFNETDDGRLVIALQGVARFSVSEELELHRGYRRIIPDWTTFKHDLHPAPTTGLETETVLKSAGQYLTSHSMEADLDSLNQLGVEKIVNMLSVHLPFDTEQKMTLLRSHTLADRYAMLIALCELDSAQQDAPIVRH